MQISNGVSVFLFASLICNKTWIRSSFLIVPSPLFYNMKLIRECNLSNAFLSKIFCFWLAFEVRVICEELLCSLDSNCYFCVQWFFPRCPIPFSEAVPCHLDLQNKGVMRTDRLNKPEEFIGEGTEVGSIKNETLLLWQPKESLQLFCCWCVGSRPGEKLHLHYLKEGYKPNGWNFLSLCSDWTPKLRRSARASQHFFFHSPVKPHYECSAKLSKSGIHIVQGETTNVITIFSFLPSLLCYDIINPLPKAFKGRLEHVTSGILWCMVCLSWIHHSLLHCDWHFISGFLL